MKNVKSEERKRKSINEFSMLGVDYYDRKNV